MLKTRAHQVNFLNFQWQSLGFVCGDHEVWINGEIQLYKMKMQVCLNHHHLIRGTKTSINPLLCFGDRRLDDVLHKVFWHSNSKEKNLLVWSSWFITMPTDFKQDKRNLEWPCCYHWHLCLCGFRSFALHSGKHTGWESKNHRFG